MPSWDEKMKREDFLKSPVVHMKLKPNMTVNQLIQQFENSGSFGAGRVAAACDVYERMIRDEQCTIFLALAGAVVPAGLRATIADLIRKRMIDALVSTGANMVHDLIEALGGHHYKGHWFVDDFLLYKYHLYRIYDIFLPEEDFVKADKTLIETFDEIANSSEKHAYSTNELMREIGSRLKDPESIVRAAYEADVPVFLPAMRDSEFAYIYRVHSRRSKGRELTVNSFREVPEMLSIMERSPHLGMIVIGGGVPRNSVQHAALMTGKGLDYAVIITTDRPESGGLSGSTLEETVSWGKVKRKADKTMVISDALIAFPLMVAAVLERLGENFHREGNPK
ncbi:MAG: deoxyhypusine synthase family protein [Candidatus Bathyarchaeota archaeon]|nr:deoxyhypusine synthase family protein [Candidatus Bathyarchaeota archaeon]